MPNCFQLTRIGDNSPSKFGDIDKAICQHFGFEWDAKRWVHGWYDLVGLMLAIGWTWPEVIDWLHTNEADSNLYHIAAWLAANYTSDAWYETKR